MGKSPHTLMPEAPYSGESKEQQDNTLQVINTHKGLYRCNRLTFGIASASAIFQRNIEKILQGIPHTIPFQDDIIITGKTDEEHLENIEKVLQRLEEHGLKVKKAKCKFFCPEVSYLGHRISRRNSN